MSLFTFLHRLLGGRQEAPREGVEHLTADQVRARAEQLSREVLGVSAEQAYAQLDRGELDGTGIEVELKLFRHLLGETPRRAA